MDGERCPDFPCDHNNCVIMEVGAEGPSAEGQRYTSVSPSPSPSSTKRPVENHDSLSFSHISIWVAFSF